MSGLPRGGMWLRGAFASMLAGTLTACVGGPALEMPVSVQPSDRLEIYWVHVYQHPKGLLVTGKVRRPSINMAPLWGHLHIVGAADPRTASPSVDARPGTLPARGNRSAPFAALLRTDRPQDVRSVSVSYRAQADAMMPRADPGKK